MRKSLIALALGLAIFSTACQKKEEVKAPVKTEVAPTKAKPIITFIELGSTTCIPCKQMKEVMAKVEAKYGSQVLVEFYDVNKDKSADEKYNVKLIPTQVFLDSNGKEFFRHEGYYPETEIDKLFAGKGVKPLK